MLGKIISRVFPGLAAILGSLYEDVGLDPAALGSALGIDEALWAAIITIAGYIGNKLGWWKRLPGN